MGGFNVRIPSRVFAARDVCRSLDLRHKELRRVANRLWYHRSEIGDGDLSGISVKLKTLPGVSKSLTNENVIRLLHEGNIETKFNVPADEKTEGIKIVQKTKEIMKNLVKAKDTDEIWNIFGQIITETGIGSGCGVYAINASGEIQNRGRLGIEGASRYHVWALPKGEKAQKIYIYNIMAEKCSRITGQAKVEYRNMLRELRFWHILDREEWPEYGLNRDVLKRALDECGLNKLSTGLLSTGLMGLFNNAKVNTLIKQLIGTVNAKLCLTEDQIDDHCGRAYKEFLAQENAADKESMDELEKAYLSTIEKIKAIAKESVVKAFKDEERVAISRNYLHRQGLNELFKILNEVEEYSLSIFKQTLHNYAEAIEDIDGDKGRYNLKSDQGLPECIRENFYYLISDTGQNPIALVLANNHEELIKTGKVKYLFEGEEGKKELLVDTLKEINDTLALALQLRTDQKELKLSNEQATKLLDLSHIMNDGTVILKDRLNSAAVVLQKLFKKNGETINSSIMNISRENPCEMEVAATTKIDPTTNQPVAWKINIKGRTSKISGWVAQIKKDVFVARGNVYAGGNVLTKEELEDIKISSPELSGEIKRITADTNNTFMTVPLISGNELLGVINVDGARLTDKDMNILRSAAVIISFAVKNSRQSEELKKSAEKFRELSIRDARTGFYNLAYFDEKMEKEFRQAKDLKSPLSLITLDLINFRDYNNKADHATGNYALTSFAENVRRFNFAISRNEENKDLVAMLKDMTIARLGGGDEFGILMPNTGIAKALQYIKKLEKFTHENPVRFEKGPFSGQSRIIFFRAGVAAYNDASSGNLQFVVQSINDLFFAADKAERTAKEQGGDPIRQAQ